MGFTIKRVDKYGASEIVACVDDQSEIGAVIDADRALIDWEPVYIVEKDGTKNDAE